MAARRFGRSEMAKQMIDQGLVEVDISGARVRRVFGHQRQTAGEIAFKAAAAVALFLLALTFLYPFWFTIILSFSGFNDALTLACTSGRANGRWKPTSSCSPRT